MLIIAKLNGVDTIVKSGTCLSTLTDESITVKVTLNGKSNPEIITGVSKVCAGYAHCVVLTKEGYLYGIGNNFKGQLGLLDAISVNGWIFITDNIKDISVSLLTTKVIDNYGYVKYTGDFSKSGLGVIKKLTYITDDVSEIEKIYKVA